MLVVHYIVSRWHRSKSPGKKAERSSAAGKSRAGGEGERAVPLHCSSSHINNAFIEEAQGPEKRYACMVVCSSGREVKLEWEVNSRNHAKNFFPDPVEGERERKWMDSRRSPKADSAASRHALHKNLPSNLSLTTSIVHSPLSIHGQTISIQSSELPNIRQSDVNSE